MFIGKGPHTPEGGKPLPVDMNSFESFLEGITNYDRWWNAGHPDFKINAKELLLEKLRFNVDYEQAKKEASGALKNKTDNDPFLKDY